MSRKSGARPHGRLRRSQLITSFGPGAMIDLPDHSVLVGGLDTWKGLGDEIPEPRLIEKLKVLFEPPLQNLKLFSPPPDNDDPTAPPTGITAWQFPEWFITQDVDVGETSGLVRSRMLVHRQRLTKGKFIDDDKKKRTVVPVRFVRACRSGHIGDIDWYTFAHNGTTECRRQLWIEERGTSGDLAEVWVRCECGNGERNMAMAIENSQSLGRCNGDRLWLGSYAREKCGETNRLLIRTASNAYFPQLMNVISLPDRNEELRQAVESAWDFIGEVEEIEMLRYERKKARVNAALEGYSDDEVFSEIKVLRGQSAGQEKSVKQAEMETLIASKDELGDDKPDGIFFARNLPSDNWDKPWMESVERVVLVHRLREVMAQVGFTRFEAVSPDIDGELEMGVKRASLTIDNPTWLPAIENRGEGVFIQFKSNAVDQWKSRPDVLEYGNRLLAGYEAWKKDILEHKKSLSNPAGCCPTSYSIPLPTC